MKVDLYIYLAMALVFLLALHNIFIKRGLLYLLRAANALKKASMKIGDDTKGGALRKSILTNSGNPAKELFQMDLLSHQMELYCADVKKMGLKAYHRSLRDISCYFNDELLEHFCSSASVEHAASGLTALGLLGTFIGLTSGLAGFSPEVSGEITTTVVSAGISALLGGIDTAFQTSMVGIVLSLLLGFLHRSIRSKAEDDLAAFVEKFHLYVMSDRSEEAFNVLLERVDEVRSTAAHDSKHQLQLLEAAADQFAMRISEDLQLKFDGLRDVMAQTAREQGSYNESTREMVEFMRALSQQMVAVTKSMEPVVEQQRKLAEELQRMNQSIEQQSNANSASVRDAYILQEQQTGITERITKCAGLLENMTANIAAQVQQMAQAVEGVTSHSVAAISQNREFMQEQLRSLEQMEKDQLKQMAKYYTETLASMHQKTENHKITVNSNVDYTERLENIEVTMFQMLRYQQKLVSAVEQAAQPKRFLRRKKK